MSVSENAQQLISHATEYLQRGIANASMAADSLNRGIESLIQVRLTTEESVATVANLLGDGHASVAPIAGVGESVKAKVYEVQGAVEVAINLLIDLDQVVTTYANTVGTTGQIILQGGS